MPRIGMHSIRRTFDDRKNSPVVALHDLTLSVEAGEFLTIIGPSGSGKTTLLRIIAGLDEPSSGRLFIAEADALAMPAGRRGVAMVFQTLALYPHMTVSQNIGFGLKLRRMPARSIHQEVCAMASRLRIDHRLDRYPMELSSGERQRVALARALVKRPQILLLDEPFSNLDPPLRRELRDEVSRLHQEFALTTLLVTHEYSDILMAGHRVVIMNGGSIEQTGMPEELRRNPRTPFVRHFLGV